MIITKSNILADVVASVTTGASSDDAANITDPDFSVFYTSSSSSTLVMSFGARAAMTYVAVAGLNIKGNADNTSYVAVNDGVTEIKRITVNTNQVVVINFDLTTFTDLIVTVVNGAGNEAPIVRYLAGGAVLTVPNSGEQSGYKRKYLERNFKNKTTLSSEVEPIAMVRKKVATSGRLNIPNASRSFSESEWQTFLEFATLNSFFILERDSLFDSGAGVTFAPSAYLCYELNVNVASAHSSTRSLNSLSIGFKAYTGL